MTLEKLNFKIGISGTFFNNVPSYSILLNGKEYANGKAKETTEFIEFVEDLDEDQEHLLEIRLLNKTKRDTLVENNVIIKDTLLNIDSISIDDIELGELKWKMSEFVGDNPDRPILQRCVNLGWNGSYRLKFSSPFYLWLLENM